MLSAIVRARCGATAVLHRTSALLIVETFGREITIMTQETSTKIPPGEVQLCTKCRIPMSVSDVFPTMPTTGLDEDELVYRCHRCGAEVKRTMERHRSR